MGAVLSQRALESTILPESRIRARGQDDSAELTYSRDGPIAMPEQVGRYRVRSMLGQGAFGQVFEAHDESLDRKVALKLLHPRVSDELSMARLQREAQALAALEHPNVVSIYDVGTVTDEEGQSRCFVAMELVDGESLDVWLRQGPHRPEAVLDVMRQVAAGLIAVHAAGMVHRDLKPGNILVGMSGEGIGVSHTSSNDGGRVRLADFGLARPDPERQPTDEGLRTSADSGRQGNTGTRTRSEGLDLLDLAHAVLTATGAVVGTPAYMAPEQFIGEPCTQRSDQFAFAVILYEALLGERPFAGKDLHGLRAAVLRGIRRPLPRRKKLPRYLQRLIDRCLQVDPELRFESMREVKQVLDEAPAGPRRLRMLGAGTLVATAAGLMWMSDAEEVGCTAPTDALGEAWDRSRRRAVLRALEDAGGPVGEQTAQRVGERLQAYAQRWEDAYRQACELPDEDPSRDRTLACLAAGRDELQVTTSVLEDADAGVVRNAVAIASQLQPPSECLQLERSAADRYELDESGVAKRLRERLAQARALHSAGRYELAASMAKGVLGEAEEAGLPQLAAAAGYRLGMIEAGSGSLEDAEGTLTRAYFAAQAIGDDETAAQTAVALVGLVGGFFGRSEDGLAWDRHAMNHLDRKGGDASIRAALEMRRGQMAWGRGDFEAAQAHFERGIELQHEADPDSPSKGIDQSSVGVILLERGRFEEAKDTFEDAVAELERAYGPMHTNTALTVTNLGHAYYELRDLDGAQKAYERARSIYEIVHGPEHVATVECDEALGNVFMARGEFDEAISRFRRTLATYQAAGQGDSFAAALTHQNLGLALAKASRIDEGVTQLVIGLDLMRKHRSADHPEVARALDTLASVYLEANRAQEALDAATEALEIHRVKLPGDHPIIAGTHKDIGEAMVALGRIDEGIEHLRTAVELLAERPEREQHWTSARFALGKALWDSGRRTQEARDMVRGAAANAEALGEPADALGREIAAWRTRTGI